MKGSSARPIILTPFNYRYGLIGGVEFTANYSVSNFSTYGNLSFQAAHGKEVESSQFNFSARTSSTTSPTTTSILITRGAWPPPAASPICGRAHASVRTCCSAPACALIWSFRTGPTSRTALTFQAIRQINLGASHAFQIGGKGPLTVRFDVINVTDKVYAIRNGTGIGVFAPQFGPPRGFYGGLAWQF